MANTSLHVIDDLIHRFERNKARKHITITKRVIKEESFSDNYHDFDMNELMHNKELMDHLLSMHNDNDQVPTKKSYLPRDTQLETIKSNLSEMKDIEMNTQSSIINYETKFKIDRFEFAIQFMIFPKSFMHCWLGFVANIDNTNPMRMPMGGIGGQPMGRPQQSIRNHYLSNLMISIPHRKPFKDEFGQSTMSSMSLLEANDDEQVNQSGTPQQMSESNFTLSANDLALKLSQMLTRISKCTVQIACDIPSQVINAPLPNRRRMNDTNVVFEIEKTIMKIYKNIQATKN